MKAIKVLKRVVLIIASVYMLICVLVYFLQEKLLFFPEKLPADFKFEFVQTPEEYLLKSKTGNEISALLFKADSAKGLIIYFHGNAGSLRTWGNTAGDLLTLHYDVLISDYTGYGKSKGKLSEENLFSDAQEVYDEMKKKYREEKILVYGRSIGTGIAAYIASQNNPQKLILESPYFSMKDLGHNLYPWLPSFLLRYPLQTYLLLPKIKCPVFIYHGTDDEVIYFESSLKLQKHFKKEDKLITIPGGHHNDLKTFDTYQSTLRKILE